MNELAPVDAFVDNDTLVVVDREVSKLGARLVIRPEDIIGKPEVTEQGIKVTFLFTNQAVLKGQVDLTSIVYPDTSGLYTIYKLSYHLANRDVPWYITAEASRAR